APVPAHPGLPARCRSTAERTRGAEYRRSPDGLLSRDAAGTGRPTASRRGPTGDGFETWSRLTGDHERTGRADGRPQVTFWRRRRRGQHRARSGRRTLRLPGVQRWHTFETRLADGSITEAVIRLANGEQVTVRQ